MKKSEAKEWGQLPLVTELILESLALDLSLQILALQLGVSQ